MSAIHVRHAPACPCAGNPSIGLAACVCGAPGSAKAKKPATIVEAGARLNNTTADPARSVRRQARPGVERQGAIDLLPPTPSHQRPISVLEIRGYVDSTAQLSGHPIAMESFEESTIHFDGKVRVRIVQRCRACAGEIVSVITIADVRRADNVYQVLGHAIRHDYARHACLPLDIALHGCTDDELDAVLQSCEVEVERVCARFKAIEDELGRRANASANARRG